MSSIEERIAACLRTRDLAQRTLARALDKLLIDPEPITEVRLRDTWLAFLREDHRIYPEGWYSPPPHGMIVAFATDEDASRVNLKSFRPKEAWPRDDVVFDRERGIMFVYASPVDRATGMIGDFGAVLYFGEKPEAQEHLSKCLRLDKELFAELEPGWKLHDIAKRGAELMEREGVVSDLVSPNDPAGTNIGHTIPGLAEGWSQAERAVFGEGDWEKIKDLINHKRRFVSTEEGLEVGPDMAFTVEPRPMIPGRADIPVGWYHCLVVLRNGDKQFFASFKRLFKLAGMDYMEDWRTSSSEPE